MHSNGRVVNPGGAFRGTEEGCGRQTPSPVLVPVQTPEAALAATMH